MSRQIQQLRDLVSNVVQAEYIEHVWKRMHDWDLDKASNWLLDHFEELPMLQEEWKARKKQVAALEESSVQGCNSPSHIHIGSSEPAPKTRYLNGEIVANKGEKYVIIDAKQEWDGGSRGKVKTKGKRGKGYV